VGATHGNEAKKPNRPRRGRTTVQPRWGWRNSHRNVIRRLKPAATYGRPLRGPLSLGHLTRFDFDGTLLTAGPTANFPGDHSIQSGNGLTRGRIQTNRLRIAETPKVE